MGPLTTYFFLENCMLLTFLEIFFLLESPFFIKRKNYACLLVSSVSDTIILFCVNLIYTLEKEKQF